MKVCITCKCTKPAKFFVRDKNRKDGLYPRCKECSRNYREQNKDSIRLGKQKEYIKNKEKYLSRAKKYQHQNKDKLKQYLKQYQEENKGRLKAYKHFYYMSNKLSILMERKNYYILNKSKVIANINKRRVAKWQQTPQWLTKEHNQDIELLYEIARQLTIQDGIQYEVDHIIPIRGKECRGLHVPWNLQILTREENRAKWAHLELT